MSVSARAGALPGLHQAVAVMGTPANRELLAAAGFVPPEGTRASDLVIAVRGADGAACAAAVSQIEAWLQPGAPPAGSPVAAAPRTVAAAARQLPGANLAVISVPGEYAPALAAQALEEGLNIFLFSNHVSLADEARLKAQAAAQGLLVMGPDCGTALLGGTALGFANAVRRGNIGIVAASGTGAQEVSTLVHRLGFGISHIIGTGGRDLAREVGGATMRAGIRLLAADPETSVLVLISKPPHPQVAAQVRAELAAAGKPAVVCFLGQPPEGPLDAETLQEAAIKAAALAGQAGWERRPASGVPLLEFPLEERAAQAAAALAPGQRYLRALYSGGTLCQEAALLLQPLLGPLAAEEQAGAVHTAIDLGAERYTRGRPHPMIDPALRLEALARAAADPAAGVILLDVVLGFCAHPDPAGVLAPAIARARAEAAAAGRGLAVVTSVCGTDQDPQGYARQVQALEAAGAIVAPSNAQAARLAGAVLRRQAGGQDTVVREREDAR